MGSSAGIVSTTDVLTASDRTSNLPPDIDLALHPSQHAAGAAREIFPFVN